MSQPLVALKQVREFWESHVNNEIYTSARRGSARYFDEIEARRYRHHYHLQELFEELRAGGVAGKSLLEVGCGIGIDTVSLARLGFAQVVGIDLTEAAIGVASGRARALGLHRLRFEQGDAERLRFTEGTFDFVYSFGVLHHTPDIARAVAEVHRVLKPGGRALVMLYHRRSLVDLVHRALRLPYESPRNLADHCPVVGRYTRREARRLFSRFDEVKIRADYPFTYGMRHATGLFPVAVKKALGRILGWHLLIDARKDSDARSGPDAS